MSYEKKIALGFEFFGRTGFVAQMCRFGKCFLEMSNSIREKDSVRKVIYSRRFPMKALQLTERRESTRLKMRCAEGFATAIKLIICGSEDEEAI